VSQSQPPQYMSMYDRFRASAEINADNWRDPQHDLDAIRLASPDERQAIEQFLIARGIKHYIDAEALALIGSPTANQVLLKAFRSGSTEVRAAVVRVAPDLVDANEKLTELLQRIVECDAYNGLDLTLTQIESVHPPEVIEAMLRRIVRDPGVVAVHFAALLLFLCGQSSEPFDWDQRPFFLRFNPGDDEDRKEAFRELCGRLNDEHYKFHLYWSTT
jgi:hypothetical protein